MRPPASTNSRTRERGRESQASRKRHEARPVGSNESVIYNVKCVDFERLEGGCNIIRPPDPEWRDFEAHGAGRGLSLPALFHGCGITGIKQDCQPAQTGNSLTQKFEIGQLERQSSDVAAWARKICDEASANWIDRDCKHDGYVRGRLFEGGNGTSIRDNDVDLLPHELGGDFGYALGASL
jgi:hypothetical protein